MTAPDRSQLQFKSALAEHGPSTDDGTLLPVAPQTLPTGLYEFCDQVAPILPKHGPFREEYEGTTFGDHLGLRRPKSRHEGHPELHTEPSIRAPAKPPPETTRGFSPIG